MDALLSLPLNYSLFIDMEKNKPINVALDDIRYKPEIINNLEYRFINDDLGMVISFIQMGSKLFQIRQPYRAKEGRIIRLRPALTFIQGKLGLRPCSCKQEN